MKQNLIADYLSCILFRVVSFFTFFLPLNFSLFLGRRLGDLIYLFDRRHRAVAYANIKKTVFDPLDCSSGVKITRKSYQAFAQNLVEITFIPRINKQYLQKYIHIENRDYVDQAFRRGKGVIFLIVHEGNWELSNIICANLGIPFVLFVRDQGFPKLNALLNAYRLKQGAKIIHKNAGVRELIEVLKINQSIGMTTDQGGKNGQRVDFFGKEASMSTGAIKLALKHDCAIIPIFYTRIKGPYTKVILDQVFTVTSSADPQNDLRQNLQRLIGIYEKYIRQYPHEYLWTYKIFKYAKEKEVLILSDGKTGHLRQSESAAKLIVQELANRGMKATLNIQEVKFRSNIFRRFFSLGILLSGKYPGHGYLFWLRQGLTGQSWQGLIDAQPDFIISAGAKLSAINYFLSKENQAKSIVLMRSVFSDLKKFDLKIIPKHDGVFRNSKKQDNLVITEGALNLIDRDYLNAASQRLSRSGLIKGTLSVLTIGVLIGGDSKNFSLNTEVITQLIIQLKAIAQNLDADILFSTSRRTAGKIETVIKSQLADYPRCKLLVIANENNHPDAVGGILGLSNMIIISPESISMISEAVSAEKYVVVFKSAGLSVKHRRFLKNYQDQGYIYLEEIKNLSTTINRLWQNKPQVNSPEDNLKVITGLDRIL